MLIVPGARAEGNAPPRYKTPFEAWSSVVANSSYTRLTWWESYTALKHSRLKNIDKATLGVAVEALCGLHQVIATLPDLTRATVRHGWLQVGNLEPEVVLKRLKDHSRSSHTYLVESKLFAVTRNGSYTFPDDIAALRPDDFQCSDRMHRFLAKY